MPRATPAPPPAQPHAPPSGQPALPPCLPARRRLLLLRGHPPATPSALPVAAVFWEESPPMPRMQPTPDSSPVTAVSPGLAPPNPYLTHTATHPTHTNSQSLLLMPTAAARASSSSLTPPGRWRAAHPQTGSSSPAAPPPHTHTSVRQAARQAGGRPVWSVLTSGSSFLRKRSSIFFVTRNPPLHACHQSHHQPRPSPACLPGAAATAASLSLSLSPDVDEGGEHCRRAQPLRLPPTATRPPTKQASQPASGAWCLSGLCSSSKAPPALLARSPACVGRVRAAAACRPRH